VRPTRSGLRHRRELGGGKVKGIPFAESDKAVNDYPITVLKNAPQSALAKQFVEFVRGSAGHAVLARSASKPREERFSQAALDPALLALHWSCCPSSGW